MKAMLRYRNGDRREVELDATQRPGGRWADTIQYVDGDDGVGGERVGLREFWRVPSEGPFLRYDEVPTQHKREGETT